MKKITVALAGNPNVGKTTILNAIAGTSLKVGNWPGVTVEKREAYVNFGDYTIHFVDLPGLYTLEPISEDEKIAAQFLEKGNVDVILNVIDSTNFERNLMFTAQLLEFEKPTVLVLNMYDEAQSLGIEIDEEKLSKLLNVKAVKTVGRTGFGIERIFPAIVEVYESRQIPNIRYSDELERYLNRVSEKYKNLQGDKLSKHDLIKLSLQDTELLKEFEKEFHKDFKEVLDEERYAFAHGIYEEVTDRRRLSSRNITDLIDNFLLHPVIGMVAFVIIMFFLFKIAFDFASPFVDWVDVFFNDFLGPLVTHFLTDLGAPQFFVRFFSEAVIGGVGFVLTFVPLIFTLFLLITFLEMSGYIPRVAFLMDKFFHKLGLPGKSLIPLLLGLGCNVPAIVATRNLETTRDRLIVMAMIPFISCPARLVVFSFFALVFFPQNAALIIVFLYFLGVLVALFTAFILRKAFKEESFHFVIELPPYRLPSIRTLLNVPWIHTKSFLYRAGTLIFGASIAVWALLNLPPGVENPKDSVAAQVGKAITPIFEPMGIDDWRATTSLIPAFLAREIVLGAMGVIYTATPDSEENQEEKEEFKPIDELKNQIISFGVAIKDAITSIFSLKIQTLQVEEEEGEGELRKLVKGSFSSASALAFMIFILVYTSCLGTYGVLIKEMGFKRATLFLVYSFVAAWALGTLAYNLYNLLA
ncbi:MAG TPA: ferrous iron transport protein B [Aquificaceae bacterium]|nr:ferrous iron transport protein B [Aquificaceae bacterium]